MTELKEDKETKWSVYWSQAAITAVGHPVEYAKVLIQVRPAHHILFYYLKVM